LYAGILTEICLYAACSCHEITEWKRPGQDLSNLLVPAHTLREDVPQTCSMAQDHELDAILDLQLIEQSQPAIQRGEAVVITSPIRNTDRSACTMLSHEVTKKLGAAATLPDDTIKINLTGAGGQSLAAWMCAGITVDLVSVHGPEAHRRRPPPPPPRSRANR
jgi:glutamate synthase (NADPH) large chain